MIIYDLYQIITLTLKLKIKYMRKKVLNKGFEQYSPYTLETDIYKFYISNLNKEEFEILNNFFILGKENLKILENDNQRGNQSSNEVDKNEDLKVNFLTNRNESIIAIDLYENFEIYGLGLKFAPFNRKNLVFDNYNTDNPFHSYFTDNLYSTSNIFYLFNPINEKTYLFIIDNPSFIRYDFLKSSCNQIKINIKSTSFQLLIVENKSFEQAVLNLYKIINNFYKPPFNAFGYTYSHWGIKSMEEIRKIYLNHQKEMIKISNICLDIDYMESYKNFTINSNFGGFENFSKICKELKEKNLYLIPIIDADIKEEKGYFPYEEFFKNGCNVKEGENNIIYKGKVWPGNCIFPDFFEQNDQKIFKNLFNEWIAKTNTSGCWLDMNEPSIFNEKTRTFSDKVKFLNGKIENIKLHNMYPYYQAKVTYESFLNNGIRPMLFSRSGYTFIGQFCGNWTGDNQPRYSHLKIGFQQIISLSLCGIMYSGTDIGGFWFNPKDKLLVEWFKASLFHPLYINHSSIFAKPREVYNLKPDTKEKIKNIIDLRYKLLPEIYSSFLSCIHYKKPYIMPYNYKNNNKTVICENIIVINNKIAYDPFNIGLLNDDPQFVCYDLSEIKIYIKRGTGVLLSEKLDLFNNIFDSIPLKLIGVLNDENSFETEIYFDDGYSSNSIEQYAIFNIKYIFDKDNKNSFKKEVKTIFSNLKENMLEKIDKIINSIEIELIK